MNALRAPGRRSALSILPAQSYDGGIDVTFTRTYGACRIRSHRSQRARSADFAESRAAQSASHPGVERKLRGGFEALDLFGQLEESVALGQARIIARPADRVWPSERTKVAVAVDHYGKKDRELARRTKILGEHCSLLTPIAPA